MTILLRSRERIYIFVLRIATSTRNANDTLNNWYSIKKEKLDSKILTEQNSDNKVWLQKLEVDSKVGVA